MSRKEYYAVIFIIILLLLPIQIIHPGNQDLGKHISNLPGVDDQEPDIYSVIGQNGSTDIYRIDQNISVSNGSTLEFLNTHVEFLANPGENYSIDVNGSLVLVNSSISLQCPGDSGVVLRVTGNGPGNGTGFLMENSTLDFNGIITATNTTVKIYNSTLESPFHYSNGSNEDLKYSFSNTTIYTANSNFSGLENHSQVGEYLAGGLKWNGVPVENSSRVVFPSYWALKPDALSNIISVTIDYEIGNTTTGYNLTFRLFGKTIYTFNYPTHNGPLASMINHFNISIKNEPQIPEIFNSTDNFSVYQHLLNGQVLLKNINVTFLSNDTVSLLGAGNFGIYLDNSTWVSYNDSLNLNMRPYYLYANVPNPGKNAIFLHDKSTLYAIGMKLWSNGSGTFTPIYATEDSHAFYFSIFYIEQENQFGDSLQPSNNITSSSLIQYTRNITGTWNMKIQSLIQTLGENETLYAGNKKSGQSILLDAYQNESDRTEFTGDYMDRTLGSVYYFSLSPTEYFNFTGVLNMVYSESYPVLNLTAGDMISGSLNRVNISIASLQGSSNLTDIEVILSNSSSIVFSKAIKPVVVDQGIAFTKTLNISLGDSIHTGPYELSLNVVERQGYANNSTWEIHRKIMAYSTAGITTKLNYTEEQDHSILANVTVNGISPYMEGSSTASFILENNDHVLEERNTSVNYSGDTKEWIRYRFTNTGNATEIAALVSLPYPGTGKTSSYLRSFAMISEPTPLQNEDYRITLHGVGIHTNNIWSIHNGTDIFASTNGNISLFFPNGTYIFSVDPPSGFNTSETILQFTVNGSNISMDITFNRVEYRLEIIEEGLNRNSTWAVSIGNISMETTRNIIQVNMVPGIYCLTFSPAGFYSPQYVRLMINVSRSPTILVENYSYTGGFMGILEGHPQYTFASAGIAVLAFLYYMDIRRRSYFPCLSCGTTWPKKRKICPGCGMKMNGKNNSGKNK